MKNLIIGFLIAISCFSLLITDMYKKENRVLVDQFNNYEFNKLCDTDPVKAEKYKKEFQSFGLKCTTFPHGKASDSYNLAEKILVRLF